jgi:hypothetical protein
MWHTAEHPFALVWRLLLMATVYTLIAGRRVWRAMPLPQRSLKTAGAYSSN